MFTSESMIKFTVILGESSFNDAGDVFVWLERDAVCGCRCGLLRGHAKAAGGNECATQD